MHIFKLFNKLPNIVRLIDNPPINVALDAIFIPSLGITNDKERLVAMNKGCMEEATRFDSGNTKYFIYSGSYEGDVMQQELNLRHEIAVSSGIPKDRIYEIRAVTSTKDELEKLNLESKKLDIKNILFISDRYHMPRLVRWGRLILPEINIFYKSVSNTKYEFAWESNIIKLISSGIKPLWILWNMAGYIITPLLFRRKNNSTKI